MNDVAKSYFVKRSLIGYSINCNPMKSFFNAKFWNYAAKFRKEIVKVGNHLPTWRTREI